VKLQGNSDELQGNYGGYDQNSRIQNDYAAGHKLLGFPELKQAGPFGSQVGALHHLARIKGLQRTLLTVQDPSDGTLAVFNTE
jgi:hypothetical protein